MARRRHSLAIFTLVTAAAISAVALVLVSGGFGKNGLYRATLVTIFFATLVFTAAFTARPLARLFPGPVLGRVLFERRGIGLGFAGALSVHILTALTYIYFGGRAPALHFLLFEGAAFLVIMVMATTSSDRAVIFLGPRNWRRLHRLGMYYVWSVLAGVYAAATYGALMRSQNASAYATLLALLILGLALRAVAWMRSPRHRTA